VFYDFYIFIIRFELNKQGKKNKKIIKLQTGGAKVTQEVHSVKDPVRCQSREHYKGLRSELSDQDQTSLF
jgi:hypothetical protein